MQVYLGCYLQKTVTLYAMSKQNQILQEIYLAPLQGYTNADYRNLHHKYFGGIDKCFSPYLRFEPHKALKKSVLKDIQPENNEGLNFVPQILGTDIQMFIDLAKQMEDWGYKEMNWNLGCPYPMVTKRGFGSALVQQPEQVREILDSVLSKINIPLSIKCRLGFENDDEIFALIDVLNQYPISELTVHTRTAKQMYKGKANPKAFVPILQKSKHPLVYNGDINTINDIQNLNTLFENKVDSFMLGRGVLMNPFLPSELKGQEYPKDEKRIILRDFHSELFEQNRQKLEPSHLLGRMITHWEYLSFIFENQHKIYKAIKKTKRIDKYSSLIDKIFVESSIRE